MAGKTRVNIVEGYAVFVRGEQHSGGDTVEMDTDTAQHWIRRGWAVEATGATKAKTETTKRATGTRTKRPTAPSP